MSVEQAHVSDDNAIISAYRQKNISFDEAKIQNTYFNRQWNKEKWYVLSFNELANKLYSGTIGDKQAETKMIKFKSEHAEMTYII